MISCERVLVFGERCSSVHRFWVPVEPNGARVARVPAFLSACPRSCLRVRVNAVKVRVAFLSFFVVDVRFGVSALIVVNDRDPPRLRWPRE